MYKCIICGKNDVTWPKVCDDCIDHEAQAELEAYYLEDIENWRCRTCGMIYDGGSRCTYCNDSNPLDDPEIEFEDDF